jgi:hypothetical protein
MMQPKSWTTAALLAIPLAACAAQPAIVPGGVHEVKAHPLPPYAIHEECVKLLAGDRIEYSFKASAPLHFNIHYHEGNAVVMPLSRDKVDSDTGRFDVKVEQEYCLMWEAGAAGTPLDYRVRLVRGKR